jgi:hypothetical protein
VKTGRVGRIGLNGKSHRPVGLSTAGANKEQKQNESYSRDAHPNHRHPNRRIHEFTTVPEEFPILKRSGLKRQRLSDFVVV